MDDWVWALSKFALRYGPAWLRRMIVRQTYQSPDPAMVLRHGIQDTNRDVQLAAIDCIAAHRPSPSKYAPLLSLAVGDPDKGVRVAAAQALGQHPSIGAGNCLVSLLRDPHPDVRESAALALGRIPTPEFSPVLEGALRDREARVPAAAADSLRQVGRAAAILPLAAMARQDPVMENRIEAEHAIVAIAKRADPAERKQEQAQELLLDMLLGGWRFWEERVQLVAALNQIGSSSMLPRLEQAFNDSNDSELHALVVDILVSLGPCPQVQNALIHAIRHTSARVRERAIKGLEKIGDKGAIFYLDSLISEAKKAASLFNQHDASLAAEAIEEIRKRSG